MIEKINSRIINFFVHKNFIKGEERDLYEYALTALTSSILHMVTITILGVCFNMLIESIVFYGSFISIRKFAGGYHAKTPIRCYLFSIISSIIVLCLIKLFNSVSIIFTYVLIMLELLFVVLILLISPLDTENNPLTEQEKKIYRMLTSIISILIFIISALCVLGGYRNIGNSMICGVIMSALVLLMRKIQIINMRIKK